MLIRPVELEAIRSGHVDLAFRRWDRPRLRAGTRIRSAIGLVEVTSVDPVTLESITDAEAGRAGAGSLGDLLSLLAGRPGHPVFRIGLRYAGADPRISLREESVLTPGDRAELIDRLARLDRASRHGAWTRVTLEVIDRLPATRAADLARELDCDTVTFKRDVRKLKELGLTESLGTGYRLAPRARSLLESL